MIVNLSYSVVLFSFILKCCAQL